MTFVVILVVCLAFLGLLAMGEKAKASRLERSEAWTRLEATVVSAELRAPDFESRQDPDAGLRWDVRVKLSFAFEGKTHFALFDARAGRGMIDESRELVQSLEGAKKMLRMDPQGKA